MNLKVNPNNPRTITEEQFERLKGKIERNPDGLSANKIVHKDGVIIAGNQRWRALQELKLELKDDWFKDVSGWTEEQVKEYLIVSNVSDGTWDWDILANEWDADLLKDWGVDLPAGFGDEEVVEDEPIKDIKDIKILNLYSGIGGNRKLWGDLKITAVEYNEQIADIYRDYFPNDEVIVSDAHKYLEDNFNKYDFIWTSPPCPTHSLLRKGLSIAAGAKPKFPDMKLYEEILFLQGYFKGKWVVENVKSWYDPLIEPSERGRHYYWSNFDIPESNIFDITEVGSPEDPNYSESSNKYGFNLDKYKAQNKAQILRNMVSPNAGKFILESAYKITESTPSNGK